MDTVISDFVEPLPLTASLSLLKDLALPHAAMGGIHGEIIGYLIKGDCWTELCNYELPLSKDGWDVEQLYHCRQALALFSKIEEMELGLDREAEAFDKFIASEKACKSVNDTFRAVCRGSAYMRPGDTRLLQSMRRKIHKILGRCPRIDELSLRIGPGATTATKKKDACPTAKMARRPACSTNLLASGRLPELLRAMPHYTDCHAVDEVLTLDWDNGDFELCESLILDVELHAGMLQFVPKNAKSFRSIVVEPFLNGLLQLGVGRWIEKRLRICGLDIKTQPEKHGCMAKLGSIFGTLATLDLSSASDTIAYWLVKYLLPADWFELLGAARSGVVRYKGKDLVLEKFSSMGNGVTFPLETLIFYALALSVTPQGEAKSVGVFGDDIIVPSVAVADLLHGFELCGFTVNRSKSFTDGPFRESCGYDYYKGFECRPLYQKHLVSGASLFELHNFYVRKGYPDFAQRVESKIPAHIRLYGPDGYGDGHLVTTLWQRRRPKRLLRKAFCGATFDTYKMIPCRWTSIYPGDHVSPLYSIYRLGSEPLFSDTPRLHEFLVRQGLFRGKLSGSDTESIGMCFTKSGRPQWPIPGSEGYKRISIYTLSD